MGFFKESTTKTSIVANEKKMPFILINPTALSKMQLFVNNCTDEIGWLGTAHRQKAFIIIDDVFLFEQEVHSTTTEITPEGLAKFAEALLQKPDGMEIWNNMKVWGHSHVYMSASPSVQDNNQMDTFAQNGQDWFIRIIANKKGDFKIDFYDYERGIIYNDIHWEEGCSADELAIVKQIKELEKQLKDIADKRVVGLEKDIKAEIDAKVKKKYSQYQYNRQDTGTTRDTQTHIINADGTVIIKNTGIDEDKKKINHKRKKHGKHSKKRH